MKTISTAILWSAMAAGSLLVAGESASVSGGRTEEPAKSGKPSIQNGMTAEEVLRLIGKPREIRRIETNGVRGESWIYRRTAKRLINQVAPTTQRVPTWGGPGVNVANGEIIDIDVPFERIERVTIYQMTALLFVDGKVVASKQWFEHERDFD